ncbi:MAG TPA: type IV pilus modification protein PilV [Albitalea sp.]|nr:type IV pilus modification protein PilV [Albitalea sp.]
MNQRPVRPRQRGFTIIEGLVAILIFSVGILALIGLQVVSIRQSSNAKYRSDASLLADQLIGQMWVTDRTSTTLQNDFATGGARFNEWLTAPTGVQAMLPNAAATSAVTNDGQVTLQIFWKAPNEAPSDPQHQYTVLAQIK